VQRRRKKKGAANVSKSLLESGFVSVLAHSSSSAFFSYLSLIRPTTPDAAAKTCSTAADIPIYGICSGSSLSLLAASRQWDGRRTTTAIPVQLSRSQENGQPLKVNFNKRRHIKSNYTLLSPENQRSRGVGHTTVGGTALCKVFSPPDLVLPDPGGVLSISEAMAGLRRR
jgi:hypothetical protein